LILPPTGWPVRLNWISMYFPNRLELSFFNVFAFPNATQSQNGMRLNSWHKVWPFIKKKVETYLREEGWILVTGFSHDPWFVHFHSQWKQTAWQVSMLQSFQHHFLHYVDWTKVNKKKSWGLIRNNWDGSALRDDHTLIRLVWKEISISIVGKRKTKVKKKRSKKYKVSWMKKFFCFSL
jgi:hypothetical protein